MVNKKMKINYKKIFAYALVALVFLPIMSSVVSAEPAGVKAVTIKNPLGNDSLESLLNKLMNIVTVFGSIVVVFFIIYSGFKFVTARGNEGEITKAKEMFYATIIGAAILLGARVIAQVVVGTVESTTGLDINK
jgi:lysylphosphatidylglycerol synthetase-like protein (DUF2156 family)